jgi:hypothetical protein
MQEFVFPEFLCWHLNYFAHPQILVAVEESATIAHSLPKCQGFCKGQVMPPTPVVLNLNLCHQHNL